MARDKLNTQFPRYIQKDILIVISQYVLDAGFSELASIVFYSMITEKLITL